MLAFEIPLDFSITLFGMGMDISLEPYIVKSVEDGGKGRNYLAAAI